MWSKISSALKPREGNDSDQDHSDAQSAAGHPPPDPFRVNATTYYTHQMPPTPPSGAHTRTTSREENIIWSLRTQLALQQELCAQFEVDLSARDELVGALTARLEVSERENDKHKNVVRSWKKKAAELEKMCRHLEHEVDNSRQESLERSIMDEASGEALRQLHRQISQLEREKSDVEMERNALAQTMDNTEAELIRLQEKLGDADRAGGEAARQLHYQISQLEREKSDVEGERNVLAEAAEKANAEIVKLQGELNATDEVNTEALRHLRSQISQLEQEKFDLQAERDAVAQAREGAAAEAIKLREELATVGETNAEELRSLRDQISQLEQEERDDFSSEIARLRTHIQQLQKDSAVMEVTIVQLNKQLDQDKEDIDGLNIALESKQQELELVKRKHGVRGIGGPSSDRTNSAPSIVGKSVGNAVPSSTVSRTSTVGIRASSPVPLRGPSALGRAANTKPLVSSGLRRASSSIAVSKTKLSSRRLSVTSSPSETDEKENTSTPVPLKHPRRTMVPA